MNVTDISAGRTAYQRRRGLIKIAVPHRENIIAVGDSGAGPI
jgi:hypothetical protein